MSGTDMSGTDMSGTDMSGTDRLEVLWQIERIRQLKARYFRAVDSKDWDLLASVFTADAVLEVAGATRTGRDEIIEVMRRRLTPLTTVHQGHMPEITITGPDTATGTWAMSDLLIGPDPAARRLGYGHYHDRYLRSDDEWRIEHCRLVRIDPPPT